MKTYSNPTYAYRRSTDQDKPPQRRPVIVVGAGPVGLAAAIDLAQQSVPVVVLDEDDTVSVGSRAICYAKRALEILDRLGCGERIVQKGVEWKVGRVFFRDEQVYSFDLLPETGHHRPRSSTCSNTISRNAWSTGSVSFRWREIRWRNKVVAVTPREEDVLLRVATPEGEYELSCEWLIVCDGSQSPVRSMLGLEAEGQIFRDRFLIADIHMKSDFPAERWFWFDPPFHPGQSALLHRQADDVWRIDFQLGLGCRPGSRETAGANPAAAARDAGGQGRVRHRMGERLHVRSAGGCNNSVMAACCLRAMQRTWCRRSARAAPTAASRMPTISSGS